MSAQVTSIGMRRTLTALALVVGLTTACGAIYNRDEFANLVKDKTSDEVASKLGRPAATDESDPSQVAWTYHNVTFETGLASKRDPKTTIVFKRDSAGKLRVADLKYP